MEISIDDLKTRLSNLVYEYNNEINEDNIDFIREEFVKLRTFVIKRGDSFFNHLVRNIKDDNIINLLYIFKQGKLNFLAAKYTKMEDFEAVKRLLNSGADNYDLIAILAAKKNNIPILNHVIRKVKIGILDKILKIATEKEYISVLEYMLEKEEHQDLDWNTAYTITAKNKNPNLLCLIGDNAHVDDEIKGMVLNTAIEMDDMKIIEAIAEGC